MKRQAPSLSAACVLFVLAAGAVSAQTTAPQGSSSQAARPSQATPADIDQQVRAAHQQLVDASRANDKEAARRLMADNMTWVNASGRLAGRDEMLQATPTPPRSVSVERVQAFGDTAIVTGSAALADGRQVRFLQEWVSRNGQWQLLAHQGTPVAAMAEASSAGAPPAAAGTSGMSAMRAAPPTLATDEERAVWKAQDDLQQAFLKGDTAAYDGLTADTYVRIAANGTQLDKSQTLQLVKRNANQSAGHLESNDTQVAVMGDTARLVMNTWGTLPGGQPAPPSRVTRVFVRRNGQWQQAAAIFTPVANR